VSTAIEFRRAGFRTPSGAALLADFSLEVATGETLVLLGRSGAGKTTTLKLANALLLPTTGEVMVDGLPTSRWDPIALRRRTGYVIQEVGLLPHLDVAANIGLVPSLCGWRERDVAARVGELLVLVGLEPEVAARYPRQLSGGQRQRVGVARALAADPPIVLMDEPFGALDPITRASLRREFRDLARRLRKTVLLVTHDVREALFLGDRVAWMRSGKRVFVGTPGELRRSDDAEIAEALAMEVEWPSS
jgi:osmoprotectant transport system ATP-binding protein